MIDALYWLVNLMLPDIAKVVSGLLVLTAFLEFLVRFKEWSS